MRISVNRLKKEIERASHGTPWLSVTPFMFWGVTPVLWEVGCADAPSPLIQFRPSAKGCSVWRIEGDDEVALGWIRWEDIVPLIQKLEYLSFLWGRYSKLASEGKTSEAEKEWQEYCHSLNEFFGDP